MRFYSIIPLSLILVRIKTIYPDRDRTRDRSMGDCDSASASKLRRVVECWKANFGCLVFILIISTLADIFSFFSAQHCEYKLELIYHYFPTSFHLTVVVFVLYAFRCYNNIFSRSCGCWSYFCLLFPSSHRCKNTIFKSIDY